MLPFAIRFAIMAHLGLIAGVAVTGPQRDMLLALPIAQFGLFVAAGIIVHEITSTGGRAWRALRRWWQGRH